MELEAIFRTVHLELRPRTPLPVIQVSFFHFCGINHTARLNNGRLTVRVSDLFDQAPPEVNRALAQILLSKLYRKAVDTAIHRTYRAFILQNDIQERARIARTIRGRGVLVNGARGHYVDLELLFSRLNQEYFGGSLSTPAMSWSAKRSRHILGRYDSSHHAIFISLLFDSLTIPSFVVEYVMYHEMLHLKHRPLVKDCRVIVHTAEFRAEEQQFPHFQAAKAWLRGI